MINLRSSEITPAAIILVLSVFFMFCTTNIEKTSVSLVSSALFPSIVLGIIAILSCVNLYSSYKKAKAGKQAKPLKEINTKKIIFVTIILLATVISMNIIGFVFAAILCISILSVYSQGQYNLKEVAKAVLLAVVVTVALKYVFIDFLQVTLPEGIFFGG